MKNIFTNIITKIALVSVLAAGAIGLTSPAVYAGADCTATGVTIKTGKDCAQGKGTQSNLFTGTDSLFKTITNVLLFLIGAVSVIMLIIGGLRYVLSNGDSSQVTNAKNTILYAVIGIVVALLAYALVNFVVSSFTDTTAAPAGDGADRTVTE